jgi:hypothetical protein
VDSPFFKYFIFSLISLGISMSKHNVPETHFSATGFHSIQHCYSKRGIWKVMPLCNYLVEVMRPWSGTFPNLFTVPLASVCRGVELGKHSGLQGIRFKMDDLFSTMLLKEHTAGSY